MRRLIVLTGALVVLLLAGALPAFASDGDLLGSGAEAPASGGTAAAPVEVVADTGGSVEAAGGDALASTGLDTRVALLVGAGLSAAGAAAIFASRSARGRS